ncbi:hypothetical protein [Corynebacterium sp. 13CS0277]|uniref:hypothetical protein n=1 Tax=Corynebacterium sp. 13CS0277 TaxID=2071994 RepID=UPI0011B201C3|nr:hypothetical protein [Corynebacterium sp. 13CS0277]
MTLTELIIDYLGGGTSREEFLAQGLALEEPVLLPRDGALEIVAGDPANDFHDVLAATVERAPERVDEVIALCADLAQLRRAAS